MPVATKFGNSIRRYGDESLTAPKSKSPRFDVPACKPGHFRATHGLQQRLSGNISGDDPLTKEL